jgi:hypothetical protein
MTIFPPVWLARVGAVMLGLFAASPTHPLPAQAASIGDPALTVSPWKPSATVGLKETFDDNVLLQNVTTNAFRSSPVTTVLPSVSVSYQPADSFHASLSYAAEINFFHSFSTEDFTLHRVLLGLDGTVNKTKWELSENFVAIDGSDIGPSFFGPGGAPAAGAPQIRDRHAAMVERGQIRVTQSFAPWFVRPVLTGYYHDFETVQRTTPGYQNYVDRSEWNAGADLGRAITENFSFLAGYRYGQQAQARLLEFPEHYDSAYQRALFGLEGKPWPWLSLNVSAGPEFRRYGNGVAAGFVQKNETYPFVEAALNLLPTTRDTLMLSAKSFEQPGFSGRSAYLDSTYEMTWRHKLGQKLTVGAGLRAYNTDFLKPVVRNDWIVTPSVVASYAVNRHLSGEISYLYDDAFSLVPNTSGREYTRNAVAVGAKYSF